MKTEIVNALELHFKAHIAKHRINVDVMLANPTAIHDHSDYMSALETEIAHIAEYMDKLEVLETHFKQQ
jgi:hypothetical protein